MKGSVYVGKKGNRASDPKIENVKNINATSGSNNLINRIPCTQFSPMYLGPVVEKEIFGTGSKTAVIFENYWQYSKVFEELGHFDEDYYISDTWYKFRDYGFQKRTGDRHPKGTKTDEVKYVVNGKKYYRYLTAVTSIYMDTEYDYISSRKAIYVPVYTYLVTRTQAFKELKEAVDNGLSVQILDFDVLEGSHDVTVQFLKERINDPTKPFGHGYVLAALLKNIDIDEFTE